MIVGVQIDTAVHRQLLQVLDTPACLLTLAEVEATTLISENGRGRCDGCIAYLAALRVPSRCSFGAQISHGGLHERCDYDEGPNRPEGTIDGESKRDTQSNTRVGITSVPMGARQSLKFSWSDGVATRVAGDFTSYAIAWQYTWIDQR